MLDDIFGRDIERIAQKFGVGRERAAIKRVTEDVFKARQAGFSKEDIDK